ncbi:unnamed protein product [Gadus morhua 'NCC']
MGHLDTPSTRPPAWRRPGCETGHGAGVRALVLGRGGGWLLSSSTLAPLAFLCRLVIYWYWTGTGLPNPPSNQQQRPQDPQLRPYKTPQLSDLGAQHTSS